MELIHYESQPTHVVGIIGGAVAGSEAAALCAQKGAIALVFEQGSRPYGKIEDGLPRWHDKLRQKEYERIDANLSRDGVVFVPNTKVGEDVSVEQLCKEYGLSAVLLANGAWRDRPLPIDGIDAYVGKGLLYQNPFVYWFNHYHEAGYSGPQYEVKDHAIVVGGGLASVDVVKVINLTLYAAALRKLGHEVDLTELEVKGIPKICEDHGVDPASLGIHGATLYYRRGMDEMPVATADDPSPEQLAKLKVSRVKIMERVMRKYLVHFEGNAAPAGAITDGDRLVGLRFDRTEVVDGRVRTVPGASFEARGPLVISSIGSVPEPIPGVPTRGELYDYTDWNTGAVRDRPGMFGLGNVLTGKGNIKDSRQNATEITEQVAAEFLGVGVGEGAGGELRGRAAARVEPAVDAALHGRELSAEEVRRVGALVKARHEAVGYTDYAAWMAAHRAE
ncbi:MAG: hypothetical protein IPH72_16885 [Sandaracinaceae bacterium]|nr:hypothetical protein [Sandaracinaceae bacterium]